MCAFSALCENLENHCATRVDILLAYCHNTCKHCLLRMQIVHTHIWLQGSVVTQQVALSPHSKKVSYFFSGVCGFRTKAHYLVQSHKMTLKYECERERFSEVVSRNDLLICLGWLLFALFAFSVVYSTQPTLQYLQLCYATWCRTDFLDFYLLHVILSSL